MEKGKENLFSTVTLKIKSVLFCGILIMLFNLCFQAQNYTEVYSDFASTYGIDKDISNILKSTDFKKYSKIAFTFYENYPDCHDTTEFWKETLTYTKSNDSVLILADYGYNGPHKHYFIWKQCIYFKSDSLGKLEPNTLDDYTKVRIETLKDSEKKLITTEFVFFRNYYNEHMVDTNITKETFDKKGRLVESTYNEVSRKRGWQHTYNYFNDTLTIIKYFSVNDGIRTNTQEKQIRTNTRNFNNKIIVTETIHDIFDGFHNFSDNGNQEEFERQIRVISHDSDGKVVKVELSKALIVKGEWTRPDDVAEIAIDVKYYK